MSMPEALPDGILSSFLTAAGAIAMVPLPNMINPSFPMAVTALAMAGPLDGILSSSLMAAGALKTGTNYATTPKS